METTEHLFRDCEWSMHFWYSSCLRVNIKENKSRHNLADWIFKIKSQLPSKGICLFFTFLWYIWYARNVLVHKKKIIQIMDCHSKALSILFEYQEANQKSKPHPEINVGKYWKPPALNVVKVNSDAAICKTRGTGYGNIIRDNNGVIIAARAWSENMVRSPEVAEAISCRMGVQLAMSLQLNQVEIESDFLVLI